MKVYVDDEPIAEVTRVHLNPGDVVVLNSSQWLSMAQAHELAQRVGALFDGHKVLVLHDGMTLSVAEPDPEPQPNS